ncbi:MAG: biotin--[acetyl-CoA-carboxylase] ligase [Erysipelotrichia bacterium]|nr:biotin--[acetyl-CoA-carboxylase] ligase [Erysipelotrichia bacterium]NCC55516.1 biotin--[acetyl-CoA-carboxylase] ligase [Erysipelotrichia bacterium]
MKNKILSILNEYKEDYISGEQIAKRLHISRVAVSKHIKKLREEGYVIQSQNNKGYCLSEENDILNVSLIKEKLVPFYYHVEIAKEVSSTNDVLKQQAQTLQEGYVLISDTQTQGKGRNGRVFHSPKQKGIYMSIFLKPEINIQQSLKLTACASVAVYDAIKKNYHLDSKIKWVNDIYIEQKKVAGILCEASLEMNTTCLEYMVVGIGINVHSYKKSDELKEIAGSIEDYTTIKIERNQFIQDILNAFYEYYIHLETNRFLNAYKANSYVLGKEVIVYEKHNHYFAKVIDIDENAALIIQKEDQSITTLSSGEISLRLK